MYQLLKKKTAIESLEYVIAVLKFRSIYGEIE